MLLNPWWNVRGFRAELAIGGVFSEWNLRVERSKHYYSIGLYLGRVWIIVEVVWRV